MSATTNPDSNEPQSRAQVLMWARQREQWARERGDLKWEARYARLRRNLTMQAASRQEASSD